MAELSAGGASKPKSAGVLGAAGFPGLRPFGSLLNRSSSSRYLSFISGLDQGGLEPPQQHAPRVFKTVSSGGPARQAAGLGALERLGPAILRGAGGGRSRRGLLAGRGRLGRGHRGLRGRRGGGGALFSGPPRCGGRALFGWPDT